jgi:hypothetical protein
MAKMVQVDKIKVLIIEDDSTSYQLLRALLDEKKIEHIYTEDGSSGIRKCIENPDIRLVLVDIKLPDIDGYTVTREIKKIRPDLPVIAVTACTLSHEREKCFISGCDDYISKPIDFVELYESIQKRIN